MMRLSNHRAILAYPTQMAKINKNVWRMQYWLDKGLSTSELEKEEHHLWLQINSMVRNAPPPPKTLDIVPGSKLIGWGWEWAVYSLPEDRKVLKVPAGIFPEVNDPLYLKNSQYAYDVCKTYLSAFLIPTKFARIELEGGEALNTIKQRKLWDKPINFIRISEVSSLLASRLISFGLGILEIAKAHEWMPEVGLRSITQGSEEIWQVRNLIIQNDSPKLFDFTAYYDVFRLYPAKLKQELEVKINILHDFINELNKRI